MTAMNTVDRRELTAALAEPFGEADVKWKPQHVSGNRAMVIAYVSARAIMDRLDDVLGVDGWEDDYTPQADGSVLCRLRCRLGGNTGDWVVKCDVGGQSEQPDGGDRRKAAFSDALKRAAVKYGIGRYLYRLEQQWVDWDPQKKKLLGKPVLPDWARPGRSRSHAEDAPAAEATPAPAAKAALPPPAKADAPAAEARPAAKAAAPLPTGEEFARRLGDKDAALYQAGLSDRGALVKAVVAAGVGAGYAADPREWPEAAVRLAVERVTAFDKEARSRPVELIEAGDLLALKRACEREGVAERVLCEALGVPALSGVPARRAREAADEVGRIARRAVAAGKEGA